MGSSFNDEIVDTSAEIGSIKSTSHSTETPNGTETHSIDSQDPSDARSTESLEPPRLKYSRLNKLPARFFTKDAVSCCYFHEKVFIFATHSGFVHLARPDFTPLRTMKTQRSSILSLHSDGEYFAAGSIDGTVVIGSVADDKDIIAYDFKRPIHAVALDKNYKTSKLFISGGTSGNVVFSSRNWLGQRQDTVVDGGSGAITLIQTINDLVIWTNDSGITVAHIPTKTVIFHETLPKNFPRPEMFWPRFHQTDPDRFLIGWVNHVWSFKISVSNSGSSIISSAASSFRSIDKKVALEHHVILEDTLIAGISVFNDDLLILSYVPDNEPPELKLVHQLTFEEISVDQVAMNRRTNLGLNDYHLYQHGSQWFLVSADDCVVVQPYGLHDQLTWYTARGEYLEAWKISEMWLARDERLDIAERHMEKLVGGDKWPEAAEFLSEMLALAGDEEPEYVQRVASCWNNWIERFSETGHRDLLVDRVPRVPVGDYLVCSRHYNSILEQLLEQQEFSKVLSLVGKWDHGLFDVETLRDRLVEELEETGEQEASVRRVIVDLSVELDEMEKCVDHLIWLKDPGIMLFVDEHHLLLTNLDKLPAIVTLSAAGKPLTAETLATTVAILVENSHEILPRQIVDTLDAAGLDYVSFLYLDALAANDKLLVKDFEDEMVKLYASFNRDHLQQFLSRHYSYSVEKAISVCEEQKCVSELVYLLSKVGENRKALKLIVDELRDPEKAILFVSESDDRELWDFLLDYSMDRPAFIQTLVVAASDLIDPIPVISRIPRGVEITGLRQALVQICGNIQMDRLVHGLIARLIAAESMELTGRYMSLRAQGTVFELDRVPAETLVCRNGLLATEEQFLGHRWKGSAASVAEKINHVAYIRRHIGR
ncbi:hypothetical protein KL928_004660 [Ogataea angusta]|uniref:Vps41 beta-propeller domain-containing protein n=1 Tax=Pichia angusta TaxID=870730 RepID=A0AAN6DC72_PICAN|nr:uncharacterized protein KL928_004660 [Ogataea angusta]KAG7816618.1 hypothetical protein KL928_004660 [Ogataea angusta]